MIQMFYLGLSILQSLSLCTLIDGGSLYSSPSFFKIEASLMRLIRAEIQTNLLA